MDKHKYRNFESESKEYKHGYCLSSECEHNIPNEIDCIDFEVLNKDKLYNYETLLVAGVSISNYIKIGNNTFKSKYLIFPKTLKEGYKTNLEKLVVGEGVTDYLTLIEIFKDSEFGVLFRDQKHIKMTIPETCKSQIVFLDSDDTKENFLKNTTLKNDCQIGFFNLGTFKDISDYYFSDTNKSTQKEKILNVVTQEIKFTLFSIGKAIEDNAILKFKNFKEKYPIIPLSETMAKTFPPLTYYVAEILISGFTILAGSPKGGKSRLAFLLTYLLSLGISRNGFEIGKECKVLYLNLDDDERNAKARFQEFETHFGIKANLDNILMVYEFPKGLETPEYLKGILQEDPGIKVIIIDILDFVLDKKPNKSIYSEDINSLKPFKKLSEEHDVAILALHHTNKNTYSEDVFDSISGSNGVRGATTSNLILKSKTADKTGKLSIEGKNLPGKMINLEKNDIGIWEIAERQDPTSINKTHEKILGVLKSNYSKFKISELQTITGISKQYLYNNLSGMLKLNLISKEGKYLYFVPNPDTNENPNNEFEYGED